MSAKIAFAVKCSLALLQAETKRGDEIGEDIISVTPSLPLAGDLYLWTFTTPDAVDLPELAYRWSVLMKRLKRLSDPVKCVRVFEPHKSHGYHVHCLAVERYSVGIMRKHAEAVGFGRINVTVIPSAKAGYVTKYLSKHRRRPGEKHVRLWSCCGFKGVKLSEVRIADSWRDWCIAHTVGYQHAHKYLLSSLEQMGREEWLRRTYVEDVEAGDRRPETLQKARMFRFPTEPDLTQPEATL